MHVWNESRHTGKNYYPYSLPNSLSEYLTIKQIFFHHLGGKYFSDILYSFLCSQRQHSELNLTLS